MNGGHGKRGQALVEFAFTAAAFLAIFFGIVDFGRGLYEYNRVGQAARLGARWAIVNTIPPPSDCATAGGTCQTKVIDYVVKQSGLDPTILTTTIAFGGTPSQGSAFTCAANPSPGCWVNVQLQYKFNFVLLPLVPATLSSSSQMVIASQYQ